MLEFARRYVTVVDRVNYRIGRVMMYFIFVMIGVLLWSSVSKTSTSSLAYSSDLSSGLWKVLCA